MAVAVAPRRSSVPPSTRPTAPPVTAVLVGHDTGPWLEETLASLGAQDYPDLSVVVVDAGGASDLRARVRSALPGARVVRQAHNLGFGAAANQGARAVADADFLLFCHDDVLLDPGAVRVLVGEALRSNAGVVGPKIVSWGAPGELLDVGLGVDKTGATASLVERHELDQQQHDGVRDVFAVPGACTLVRADLFAGVGGFDPAITLIGDDLDLCWRAQVAGARIVVASAARVQHREALGDRRSLRERRRLSARHRLRSVLVCYSLWHLLRVLPQAGALTLTGALSSLLTRHPGTAVDELSAWSWNLRRLRDLRRRRAIVARSRRLGDAEVRRLQVRGSARLSNFVRHVPDRRRPEMRAGRRAGAALRPALRRDRLALGAILATGIIVVLGSRHLLGHPLPAVAGFAPFDQSPGDLLRAYADTWPLPGSGSGSEVVAPTAVALLGLAGLVVLGTMDVLQQLLVLGALPLGLLGVWRLTAPLASPRAGALGVVVYAAVPLPYDALARGRWGALVLYAAAPWLLARIAVATGDAPFTSPGASPPRRPGRSILNFGLLLAVVGAFVPLAVVLVGGIAVVLVVVSPLTGGAAGAVRAAVVTTGASVVAVVVHLPWLLHLLGPGGGWSALGGVSPLGNPAVDAGPGLVPLARLSTEASVSPLAWGLLAAAALPLLVGRGSGLRWAARCWFVALGCWALAWVGGAGLLPVALPPAGVLLAPSAAALALAAALGMAAVEREASTRRFSGGRALALAAAAAAAVATLPVAADVVDGRWGTPDRDFAGSLTFLDEAAAAPGPPGMLWLGRAEALPLASHPLGDGAAWALSDDATPGVADRWSGPVTRATEPVEGALRLAVRGGTQRLGSVLGPLGVRWVILVDGAAPTRTGAPAMPLPAAVREPFARQLDLRRIEVDPALDLYENLAWETG